MGIFENIMKNINNTIDKTQHEIDDSLISMGYIHSSIKTNVIENEEYIENINYLKRDNENLNIRKKEQEQLINSYVDNGLTNQDDLYKNAFSTYQKIKYDIAENKKKMKHLRPNTQKDIEYRKKQMETFTKRLQATLSNDLKLRFHGTPIYYAEEILNSGKITSTAERLNGYNRSFDSAGIISVTDINSLDSTIKTFSGLDQYSEGLPAGCIFVLRDEQNSFDSFTYSMRSVDFIKNPKSLYGIITTPENIDNISQLVMNLGFPANKVQTFDDFIKIVERDCKKQEIQQNRQPKQDNLTFISNIDEEIQKFNEEKLKEHNALIASLSKSNKDKQNINSSFSNFETR